MIASERAIEYDAWRWCWRIINIERERWGGSDVSL